VHHFEKRALLPIVFLAVDIGTHCLEGQCTFHKNHFAVFSMRNTLRLDP
jgi:hypothetical protein